MQLPSVNACLRTTEFADKVIWLRHGKGVTYLFILPCPLAVPSINHPTKSFNIRWAISSPIVLPVDIFRASREFLATFAHASATPSA
jgi:hypothetical protein